MLEPKAQLAFREPIRPSPTTHYKVQIKGGILADEMGLGKTITLLGKLHRTVSNDFTLRMNALCRPIPVCIYVHFELYISRSVGAPPSPFLPAYSQCGNV